MKSWSFMKSCKINLLCLEGRGKPRGQTNLIKYFLLLFSFFFFFRYPKVNTSLALDFYTSTLCFQVGRKGALKTDVNNWLKCWILNRAYHFYTKRPKLDILEYNSKEMSSHWIVFYNWLLSSFYFSVTNINMKPLILESSFVEFLILYLYTLHQELGRTINPTPKFAKLRGYNWVYSVFVGHSVLLPWIQIWLS